MNEPKSQNLKIALLLSKANLSMSQAEAIESCKIYFKITSFFNIDNLMYFELVADETEHSINLLKTWLGRLALTKEAHVIIGQSKFSNLERNIPQLHENFAVQNNLSKIISNKDNPTFKISIRNTYDSSGTQNTNQKNQISHFVKLLAECGFNKANMKSPDFDFIILNCSTVSFFGIKIWETTDKFEERKAHKRPVLHPTAMNPRLARAMINLAGARGEILDPFCGAGGILLEAARINLHATGLDISQEMIMRAEKNFIGESEFIKGLITTIHTDALQWNTKAECVITDLPYGKSSKLDQNLHKLTSDFLEKYKSITNKIVLCLPNNIEPSIPLEWKVKFSFEIYIHKSLTRKILMLQK